IQEQLGSVVTCANADEGRYQLEAGCPRADAMIAVTGDDEDNLIISQVAKFQCHVSRAIARVNNPKNEIVFKTLGIDETVSSTRVLMAVIEQELPTGGFMPLMPLAGSRHELIEAGIQPGAPSAGKTIAALALPGGAVLGAVLRDGQVLRADDRLALQPGDRIVVFAPTAAEAEVRKAIVG
ncbi:MAG: TrkA family potassium uptake protein, partial [Chloroflexi bacterium]|nr:TrkA family potassium uptake protein [Chloroflexota bacterium]